ncbi:MULTISPECIES: hypothetical protein [Halorubrum]|uniref:hypothetical protein n=1 Tax=Halorubrum TaxID=56688 RepID=UPI001181A05B|nr:hypothetical protein [Halorubrum persicum]
MDETENEVSEPRRPRAAVGIRERDDADEKGPDEERQVVHHVLAIDPGPLVLLSQQSVLYTGTFIQDIHDRSIWMRKIPCGPPRRP